MRSFIILLVLVLFSNGCKSRKDIVNESAKTFINDLADQNISDTMFLITMGIRNNGQLRKLVPSSVIPVIFMNYKSIKGKTIADLRSIINLESAMNYLVTLSLNEKKVSEWFFTMDNTSRKATPKAGDACYILNDERPEVDVEINGVLTKIPLGNDTGLVILEFGEFSQKFRFFDHEDERLLVATQNMHNPKHANQILFTENQAYKLDVFQNILAKANIE